MKKSIYAVLVILCLFVLQTAALADENAAAYLETYYGVSFGSEVTAEDFNKALTALGTEPLECEELTMADAVTGAVRLASMEELALTYKGEKAAQFADAAGITADDSLLPYLACASDLGLIEEVADPAGPVSPQDAASMLYRGAELSGKGRRFIGRLSDSMILAEARTALHSIISFDDEILNTAGINILVNGATTGYSMKYSGFEAHFLEENTLRYGHDNPTHMLQVIALLQSEGIDAYLQIEPKVSVYEYLLDWGAPGEPTPTYAVREMMDGRYFAFALEYEIVLEFDSAQEKESFHDLIETYAKKYDDRVDENGDPMEGLLYQSWWQPFYYSVTEMDNEEYTALTDNVISGPDGTFVIHSVGLPEQSSAIAAAVAEVTPDLQTEEKTIYVNPAFYRYITGSDHQ